MTLVELMVAVGVTTIIMALSTLIFMSQYKSYRTSHATKTTETDIQKAVEYVRDDVTLAGWAVKPQMAFYFVDGGQIAPRSGLRQRYQPDGCQQRQADAGAD